MVFSECTAQKAVAWKSLEISRLEEVKDTVHNIIYDAPVFSKSQIRLNQKAVTITGYINTVFGEEGQPPTFIIQAIDQFDYGPGFPMDAIVQVHFIDDEEFIDKNVLNTIEGIFQLNSKDPTKPFYSVKNAVLLGQESKNEQ